MAVEVKVLEDFGREAVMRKKWMKTWQKLGWQKLGERILKLPKWMQDIVLEDVNTALRNRIAVMEIIQNAKRNH